MADGKVVIETDLDSSGIESALKKLGNITTKGLKAATTAITGTTVALGGIATAAIKVGSDFESQMSRVKAISGATGEEFNKLKDQAIQLGADTAFSSKQAAEGMENLAAAGFVTNEIVDAMPGLLSLAAAAGEDLATSSDIAASTLRGFGLEAQDMAHVADVLAANANRTNSSVAQTGEAMKYIAPLARAAGLSLEETAAAIGIMADAGIQGSQAGTTLRGAISRLSKPTDDMKAAMDELGISFYDSNGKMKSLTEQVGILRKATEGMTDEQKNNLLVTLYGQEALSGMMALINEGEGSLGDLTEAYKNCDGEAQKAAETMQDNLSSALEQLGGSAESLGIVFYESVAENLKKTAQSATDSVNNITEAFKSGGLNEAIQTAGDEFANLATAAAEHAPEMVDTAVHFIESFAGGIIDNRSRLYESAVDMAQAIGDGLADLLPDEIGEPVSQAVDEIAESLSSGGLKEAGETIETTLENVIDVVGELADVALPPLTKALDFAGDHFEVIAASTTAAFTAFKGYKVVQETTSALNKGSKIWKTASAAVDAFSAAQLIAMESGTACNVTLTAGQAVVGLLTGKITLATAAQTAWNVAMNANPIGIVITAVGALTAGLGVYALTQKSATDETYKLSESQKKMLDSCHEVTQGLQEEHDAREKNVQSIDREYDNYESLLLELQQVADQNGKVKEGCEEKARVITGQLADALGLEIELTDGLIQNYQESIDKIKELIVQKKAEALLSSMQEEMANAYDKTQEAMNAYKEAADLVAEKDKAVEVATSNLAKAEELHDIAVKTGTDTLGTYALEVAKQEENLKAAKAAQEQATTEMENAKTALSELSTEVNNYNALQDAMATGETAKIEAAMTSLVTSYKSYTAETLASSKEARDEMYNQANTFVENIKLVQDKSVEVADDIYKDMARSAAESIGEFSKLPGGIAEGIKEIGPEASSAIISALAQADIDGKLDAEAKAGLDSFINGFSELDAKTQETWGQAWYGALKGLEGFEKLKDPAKEGSEAFLQSLIEALEVHSPSRAVKAIFSNVWPGAIQGLEDGKEGVVEKGRSVIADFLRALGGEESGQKAHAVGADVMRSFEMGAIGQKGLIDIAAQIISESLNTNLGNADTQTTGLRKLMEYNEGVRSQKGIVDFTSNVISDSSNANLGSANTRNTGIKQGGGFDRGLGSTRGTINSTATALSNLADKGMAAANTARTGKNQATNFGEGIRRVSAFEPGSAVAQTADSGLGSIDATGTGSNFVQGFANGFGLVDIWSAAWSIGKTALSALSSAIKEGSPSRLTRQSGKYFGQGFHLGIKAEEKEVAKASDRLGEIALNSLDLTAISQRMRDVMSFNTNRISRGIGGRNINMQHMTENALKLDYDLLADKISGKMTKAIAGINWTMEMDKKPVGRILAPEINRQMELIKRSERMR